MESELLLSYKTPYSELHCTPVKKHGGGKEWNLIEDREGGNNIEFTTWDFTSHVRSSTPFFYMVDGHDYIETQFNSLKDKWLSEIRFSSNPIEITENENYKKIASLGVSVVPYLLEDMKVNHTHWFTALQDITEANPVKENHIGHIPAMIKDWLRWFNV